MFLVKKVIIDKFKYEITEKKKEIENLRERKDTLRKKLEEINEETEKIRKELDVVTTNLMYYYHKILNEGTDIRTEGLVWVIKAIWNLGCPIIPGYMPIFLEEKTAVYLFTVK